MRKRRFGGAISRGMMYPGLGDLDFQTQREAEIEDEKHPISSSPSYGVSPNPPRFSTTILERGGRAARSISDFISRIAPPRSPPLAEPDSNSRFAQPMSRVAPPRSPPLAPPRFPPLAPVIDNMERSPRSPFESSPHVPKFFEIFSSTYMDNENLIQDVERLIDNGASLKDILFNTFLHFQGRRSLVNREKVKQVVRLLLDRGWDPLRLLMLDRYVPFHKLKPDIKIFLDAGVKPSVIRELAKRNDQLLRKVDANGEPIFEGKPIFDDVEALIKEFQAKDKLAQEARAQRLGAHTREWKTGSNIPVNPSFLSREIESFLGTAPYRFRSQRKKNKQVSIMRKSSKRSTSHKRGAKSARKKSIKRKKSSSSKQKYGRK